RVWSNAAAPSRPTSSLGVNTSSMPACGRLSASTRRVASSITATADLLSAPRIVPAALRTTPSSTTGSIGPVGGTVSRCAQRKSGEPSPSPCGSTRQYRLPIVEPTFAPASSSSTSSPRSRRYRATASATARSSPGGLGSAASSVNRSRTSDAMPRSYGRLGRHCADRHAGPGPGERGADEFAEERRGTRRSRLELRMELARDDPRVVRKLHDLDEPSLLERPGDDEPGVHEHRPVVVVHLVAMAVPLVDDRVAVRFARARAVRNLDRLRTQPHRAAAILDLLLLGQQIDDPVRRLGIHLRRF